MSKMIDSIYNMRLLDDLAQKDSSIHKIHPLAKLFSTLIYLVAIVSFGRYEIGGLFPYVFYPIMIFAFGELPIIPILKRVLIVEPFIIGIGILNPLFDHYTVAFGGIAASRGWVTFFSIFIKCGLTVVVSILLVATTGMERLASALRMLKIPKLYDDVAFGPRNYKLDEAEVANRVQEALELVGIPHLKDRVPYSC